MGVAIPPKAELDLDLTLGREKAERSNQILVAFEEGYLQTVHRESGAPAITDRGLEERLASFKTSLSQELGSLRTSLAGDVREMLAGLKVAKMKLNEEKERV